MILKTCKKQEAFMVAYLLIALVVFFMISAGLTRRGVNSMSVAGPTLVLRRFNVDEKQTSSVSVDIAGRSSGVTAWILTVLGFDTETSIQVREKDIVFKSSSLQGQILQVVPITSVSCTYCGYSKPIGLVVVGFLSLVLGLATQVLHGTTGVGLGAGFLVFVIFVILYYFSKKILISLETRGGMVFGLYFKPSVIESVFVDIDKANKAIEIINSKAVKYQVK
jgi:hypothetical protein